MTVEIVKGRKYIDNRDGEVLVALLDGTDRAGDGVFASYLGGQWYLIPVESVKPFSEEAWRNLYEDRWPGLWHTSRESADAVADARDYTRFAVQRRLPDGNMEFEYLGDGS